MRTCDHWIFENLAAVILAHRHQQGSRWLSAEHAENLRQGKLVSNRVICARVFAGYKLGPIL